MTDPTAERARQERTPEEVEAVLRAADLGELARRVADEVERRGIPFGETRWKLDPVPRLLPPHEWETLERGLVQRVRALNAFVCDVYADRRIIAAGVIPERVVETSEYHCPELHGRMRPVPVGIAGVDVVRDERGRFRVLEDNVQGPSGFAYATAAREVLDACLDLPETSARRDPAEVFGMIGEALRGAAPEGVEDPHVVVISDGEENSAWFEHRLVAERLGVPVARPDQLELRDGALRLDGRRVDVAYRRTDDLTLRGEIGRKLSATTVVTAYGAGVADDKLAHAYVDEMVRFYLGEEPLVPSVPTFDLGDERVRESVLERLGELVVKGRWSSGGEAIHVGSRTTPDEREQLAAAVRDDPNAWIAQETIALSHHDSLCDGVLEPRRVDLRAFVFSSPERTMVQPGGLTRVALERGSMIVNSSAGGGAKDTWVLA